MWVGGSSKSDSKFPNEIRLRQPTLLASKTDISELNENTDMGTRTCHGHYFVINRSFNYRVLGILIIEIDLFWACPNKSNCRPIRVWRPSLPSYKGFGALGLDSFS